MLKRLAKSRAPAEFLKPRRPLPASAATKAKVYHQPHEPAPEVSRIKEFSCVVDRVL
ncbi:hypothetical protein [Ensifer adhaerens]|uniref:hypothetical protein n=1 Tax=Ensifer adhaerens TaxID=106592 RepID=UPI00131A2682|nr:hypothetical protein [Ensifer adhaerens]